MARKPTEFGTIAGMTGLIGVLPLLITLAIAQTVPALSAIVLTALHVTFMGFGAWIFAAWFGN